MSNTIEITKAELSKLVQTLATQVLHEALEARGQTPEALRRTPAGLPAPEGATEYGHMQREALRRGDLRQAAWYMEQHLEQVRARKG